MTIFVKLYSQHQEHNSTSWALQKGLTIRAISLTNRKTSIYSLQGFPCQFPFKWKISKYFSGRGCSCVPDLNRSYPRDHEILRGRPRVSLSFFLSPTGPAPVCVCINVCTLRYVCWANVCMLNWIQGASWIAATLYRNNWILLTKLPYYKSRLQLCRISAQVRRQV